MVVVMVVKTLYLLKCSLAIIICDQYWKGDRKGSQAKKDPINTLRRPDSPDSPDSPGCPSFPDSPACLGCMALFKTGEGIVENKFIPFVLL